ncbi:hypothetical protein [Serratia quinivorans]|uniref:hypothetical protein n=1 Tax=Serratia quinivorans TaxID=137545 RepID=UPI003F9827BC
MNKVVIDTNVLLVANFQHPDVSDKCIKECICRLKGMQARGVTVIDDGYRILGEYQHKTHLTPPKGVGDVFLKWLLRNLGNQRRVEAVSLNELETDCFVEFPDPQLEPLFDAPDRKFVAVANAHPDKPPIWQAADCKWLDWWPNLEVHGIHVDFLCSDDVCSFYNRKFPNRPLPELPG